VPFCIVRLLNQSRCQRRRGTQYLLVACRYRDPRHKLILGKFRNDHVAQDSTDRMAKIRLPAKLSREMRRKHGCKLHLGGASAPAHRTS
jgi:hypothetical protein